MKIRIEYLIAFLSCTLITFVIVGVSFWGFNRLEVTTDYLVNINSRVLEHATSFEKDLAKSRRAEKEFFIFPNNIKKQDKYIKKFNYHYAEVRRHIANLTRLLNKIGNPEIQQILPRCTSLMNKNERLWNIVTVKYKDTKSYDEVNTAEYGLFKKNTHVLEDSSAQITGYGLAEVEKGRKTLMDTQAKTRLAIQIITAIALLWGILLPIFLTKKLTATILYLAKVTDDISRGKIGIEIQVSRKDELGVLANSIIRMQKSLRILLKRYKEARLQKA